MLREGDKVKFTALAKEQNLGSVGYCEGGGTHSLDITCIVEKVYGEGQSAYYKLRLSDGRASIGWSTDCLAKINKIKRNLPPWW